MTGTRKKYVEIYVENTCMCDLSSVNLGMNGWNNLLLKTHTNLFIEEKQVFMSHKKYVEGMEKKPIFSVIKYPFLCRKVCRKQFRNIPSPLWENNVCPISQKQTLYRCKQKGINNG